MYKYEIIGKYGGLTPAELEDRINKKAKNGWKYVNIAVCEVKVGYGSSKSLYTLMEKEVK